MIPADFEFRLVPPEPPLAEAVGSVWHAQGTSPHGRERILPAPAAVLLVVLGPPLRMSPPGGNEPSLEIAGAWISGPHERPIINEPTAETHVVGVTFRPGGFAPFMRGPVGAVANALIPLDDIDSSIGPADAVESALAGAADADEAIAWLTARLRDALPDDGLEAAWQHAIATLCGAGSETVEEIRAELGVSRRHFVEQMRRRAGLTPKSLQRIARMRRLLNEIDARRPIRWSAEAVGAGYFDQPHAIRDFRTFTGMTPTEYIARRRAAWGDDVEPGEATNFVPELIR